MKDFNEKYEKAFGVSFWDEDLPASSAEDVNTCVSVLIDTPIRDLIKRYKLRNLPEFDFYFELYAWKDMLQKAMTDCLVAGEINHTSTVAKIDTRLCEIDDVLNGTPVKKTERTTRTTNLKKAIIEADKRLTKKNGGKPCFDEVWQFFQDDMDETGFIQDYDDDGIVWIDTKGALHDTKKKTVQNMFSRINNPT